MRVIEGEREIVQKEREGVRERVKVQRERAVAITYLSSPKYGP